MHLYKSPFPSHPPPQRPSRLQHGSVSAGFFAGLFVHIDTKYVNYVNVRQLLYYYGLNVDVIYLSIDLSI